MESKITISIPYQSKDEFEERQKKIFGDLLDERLSNQGKSNANPGYGTRKQVASKLHISLPTLNVLTKTGILTGYRIKGRVLYKWDEIDHALTRIEAIKYKRGQ